MRNTKTRFITILTAVGLAAAAALDANAAQIVCWKDKAGKTIGCGDKVPPEYQSSATRELDSRGITRKQTESVEDTNARRQREQEAARVKADDERKRLDQQRQDTALLETFSNEKEIDLKRDRDIGVIDGQLEQLQSSLKSATARHSDAKSRVEQAEKGKAGASASLKDELQRVTGEKDRLEKSIQAKQNEKEELRKKYAEYKRRYSELRSGGAPTATAAKK